METQTLFNIVVGIAGFFGGFLIHRIFSMVDKLEDKINDVPLYYVSKDDYHNDVADIKLMLNKIWDKLDSKADK